LATEGVVYLDYPEAVALHITLMRHLGESRFGVAEAELIHSALARPRQAAHYEKADLIRQAATLCLGLIKNHPWLGGNKRTATLLVSEFLFRNNVVMTASVAQVIELVLAIESDRFGVDEIEAWYRQHTATFA
jgi:death on curing protein